MTGARRESRLAPWFGTVALKLALPITQWAAAVGQFDALSPEKLGLALLVARNQPALGVDHPPPGEARATRQNPANSARGPGMPCESRQLSVGQHVARG